MRTALIWINKNSLVRVLKVEVAPSATLADALVTLR